MTQILNLRASNNATFRLTRDFSNVAETYNIPSSVIRLQARTTPFAPDPPAYQWLTAATSGGSITFDPTTNLCVISAPEPDMARLPLNLVYDCRLELSDGAIIPLFAGRLIFSPGVTRTGSESDALVTGALADTVTIDGEPAAAPTPLPLSLSAALINAQNAATTAQAAAEQASASASSTSSLITALIYG